MALLSKLKYGLNEVSENITDRAWVRDRVHAHINAPVQRRVLGDPINYDRREWDTLIILDACRADLFEDVISVDRWDSYERGYSGAGATDTWLKRQWADEYGDTVYVSGSPMVSKHASGSFHDLIEVWRDSIDEELEAPSAEPVTEAAIQAHKTYPNKRIIVHYIHPHYPFVKDPDLQFSTFKIAKEWELDGDSRAPDVWEALRMGIVEEEEVQEGYRRNLEYVMDHVDDLLDEIDGRIVITADHGNLYGKWTWPIPFKEYGHHAELVQPALTTVPWAVRSGTRRDVINEGVKSASEAASGEIESHLEALGYV